MRRRTVLTTTPLAAAGILSGTGSCSPGNTSTPSTNGTPAPTGSPERTGASPGATYSVSTQELSFQSSGNHIHGEIRRPDVETPCPVAIMSHGLGGNHTQGAQGQDFLAQHGVVVYSFDFAGGAAPGTCRSEGATTEMSVLTEAQNLRDALTQIRSLDYVDANRVHLVGTSQGGVVTTLVANENPAGVRGITLLCPAFSLFDDARRRFANESDIPETYDLLGLVVGRKYFTDIRDMNIYGHMSNFTGTVRIFHGTADSVVPFSYSERAAGTFANATLTPLDGEGHNFSGRVQETVAGAILHMVNG
ncbi:alpha/beta hydrolase family protein [[Pseudopropionibacterium] massiliense]|uniref:alpha/beta hydrolase family protein n=1 Tax=[Pseudopropionibacterium] massiliense TaxID=2220000 RepID=UPI0010325AB1|nr:alpha/beta hydrolase [[Pseudopropionibacterium] massiliense]